MVIRFQGGLGNQMFQYALYRELQWKGKDVKADLYLYRTNSDMRKFEIEDVFGIKLQEAKDWEILKPITESIRIERFIKKNILRIKYLGEHCFKVPEDVFKVNHGFLDGYWQSVRYFPDVVTELKNEFTFCNPTVENYEITKRIMNSNAVSVHIRLGDYLQHPEQFGNLCTEEYYKSAIQYMRHALQVPHFFIFSDEIDKAQKMLGKQDDITYVKYVGKDYQDMQLMSLCKHNIIANSSFSWWGAWLNKNDKKILIVPTKWNQQLTNPYICEGLSCIKIDSKGKISDNGAR